MVVEGIEEGGPGHGGYGRAMRFRAIATDLDGTLLRSDQSVSPRTREAIQAAEDAGMLVVIATGRPPRWIAPVVEQLGDRGLVVCANGASVYDPARHELVHRIDLDPLVARSIVDDLESGLPEAVLGVEQGFDFGVDQRYGDLGVDILDLIPDIRVAPIRSFLDEPVTKLIVRLPHPAPPGTAARVQAIVGSRALVTHSTHESFLELSDPRVHKAHTVELLLEEHGHTSADVVAFGDMPNDLELIRWAALGVAMANAHPDLLAAADLVTTTNDDDGVARVIEQLLAGTLGG
jgi:hydroxymethylpyrimidine pyrophosphatase-like HAD family hydrolase